MHQASLPKNFAQQVLDLEGEIDFNCELSTVKRLIELYTAAIEFYEAVQNNKYLHYKDRLQALFSRNDVLELLEHRDATKQRPRRKTLSLSHASSLMANRSAEKELSEHYSSSSNLLRKLQQNIQNQCSSLAKRLHERRLKNRSLNYDAYEAKLSETLEWFLEPENAKNGLKSRF